MYKIGCKYGYFMYNLHWQSAISRVMRKNRKKDLFYHKNLCGIFILHNLNMVKIADFKVCFSV